MLEGRDGAVLKDWLKSHQKIRLVARDRASSYASAISEVLPECTQVADRFHLMQNLLERMKEIFKTELPSTILIKDGKVVGQLQKTESREEAFDKSRLEGISYDNLPPTDESGAEVAFVSRKRNLNSLEYKSQQKNRKKNSS